jgi:uncharacterized protein (TIGR01741 family)
MEMELKMDALYQNLAQKLQSMIPSKWIQLYYLGEVEKGRLSCSSIFYFSVPEESQFIRSHDIPGLYNVSEKIYFDLLSESNLILLDIYDCFISNNQEPWEQINLSLSSTGEFNIDFIYNVMHKEDGGQSRREVIWAYETFGHLPPDRYSRGILDKYVNGKHEK